MTDFAEKLYGEVFENIEKAREAVRRLSELAEDGDASGLLLFRQFRRLEEEVREFGRSRLGLDIDPEPDLDVLV